MEDCIFKVKRGNFVYPVGTWGHLAYMAGAPGSSKSTHITYMAASALKNDWVLGYHLDLQGRNMMIIDGEQPPDLYRRSYDRIGELCGGENMNQLIFPEQSLAVITDVKERRKAMFKILRENAENLGVVFIDRIGNFISDPNNSRESERLISQLYTVTERTNCMMILVSHVTLNKYQTGETKLFGMIGSFIKQGASWGLLTEKQSKYFGLKADKTRYPPFPALWAQNIEGTLIPEPYCPF